MDEPAEDILTIKPGEVTVKATITHKYAHQIKNGSLMTDAVIADKTGTTKAIWFSRQAKDDLIVGSEYTFSGNYRLKYGRLALQSPNYKATGENPSMNELAKSPLILPARNYTSKKSPWKNWPEWAGAAILWLLIIVGIAYAFTNHSQKAMPGTTSHISPQVSSSTSTLSSDQSTPPVRSHNGIPEIPSPTQADNKSKCINVTSYDYDWNDDVLCTRQDGSQFYTNYAGGQAIDPTFKS